MTVSAVMDAYRSAYFQCKLDGDKVPSARAIQTLVQAWREMWDGPRAASLGRAHLAQTFTENAPSPVWTH
jgi:hypothetical protein